MDRNLTLFLELVDCQPEDVIDVPPERLHVNHAAHGEGPHCSSDELHASLGDKQIYFGMHKGKQFKDVPKEYLEWAIRQNPTNRSFRKFQGDARDYLRLTNVRPASPQSRSAAEEWRDPLTREYLQIVGR